MTAQKARAGSYRMVGLPYSPTHTTVLGPAWLTRHDRPPQVSSVISAGSGALTGPPRHPLNSETRKARQRLAALRRLE